MKRCVILLPFALAACQSQPTVKAENASVAEVATKTGAAVKLAAGQWTGTTEITEMNMPGVPAGTTKQALTKTSYSSCLTPQQVEKPPAEMLGGKAGQDCRYERFTLSGGKIDALMVCKPEGAGEMRLATRGSYAGDRYDVTSDMAVTMPANAGGGTMTMKARTSGKRTGECKA